MDYYQKYLKYKAKYIAVQEGGLGGKVIADFKKLEIPPYLQDLDDAFLPGFNVDKDYVTILLSAAKIAKDASSLVEVLKALNNLSDGGLNANGDRMMEGQTKKTKTDITKTLNTDNADYQKLTLDNYKKVSDNLKNKMTKEIKNILVKPTSQFQALDDAFLPGFNVDKLYVGRLYLYAKLANTPEDLIKKLIILNNSTDNGLNSKGDRLVKGQTKQTKQTIDENLKKMLENPNGDKREEVLKGFKS